MTDHDHNTTATTDGGHGHTKPSYDDINITSVVIVGLLSALFTFLAVAFVQGLYYQWNRSYENRRLTNASIESIEKAVTDQKNLLAGDPEKGIIPIEEAMDNVVREFSRKAKTPSRQEEPNHTEGHSDDGH